MATKATYRGSVYLATLRPNYEDYQSAQSAWPSKTTVLVCAFLLFYVLPRLRWSFRLKLLQERPDAAGPRRSETYNTREGRARPSTRRSKSSKTRAPSPIKCITDSNNLTDNTLQGVDLEDASENDLSSVAQSIQREARARAQNEGLADYESLQMLEGAQTKRLATKQTRNKLLNGPNLDNVLPTRSPDDTNSGFSKSARRHTIDNPSASSKREQLHDGGGKSAQSLPGSSLLFDLNPSIQKAAAASTPDSKAFWAAQKRKRAQKAKAEARASPERETITNIGQLPNPFVTQPVVDMSKALDSGLVTEETRSKVDELSSLWGQLQHQDQKMGKDDGQSGNKAANDGNVKVEADPQFDEFVQSHSKPIIFRGSGSTTFDHSSSSLEQRSLDEMRAASRRMRASLEELSLGSQRQRMVMVDSTGSPTKSPPSVDIAAYITTGTSPAILAGEKEMWQLEAERLMVQAGEKTRLPTPPICSSSDRETASSKNSNDDTNVIKEQDEDEKDSSSEEAVQPSSPCERFDFDYAEAEAALDRSPSPLDVDDIVTLMESGTRSSENLLKTPESSPEEHLTQKSETKGATGWKPLPLSPEPFQEHRVNHTKASSVLSRSHPDLERNP